MFLYNTKTKDFPLSKVDITYYEPNWTEEQPIPDYFVEVEIEPFLMAGKNQVMMSNEPKLIGNKWVQTHYLRDLTEEEIADITKRKLEREQIRKDLGLPPEERPVVLDENGNVIIDQWGNAVEPEINME